MLLQVLVLYLCKAAAEACDCGRSAPQTRIVGGSSVQGNPYPWLVALKQGPVFQFCGATVISKSWLLTAAHCVENMSPEDITAVVGQTNIARVSPANEKSIDLIVRHPDYVGKSNTFHDDIALLRLSTPLEFGAALNPVCLPDANAKKFSNLVVAGWGSTDPKMFSPSQVLKHIEVELENDCKILHRGKNIWSKQICATGGFCNGDSGGPLLTKVGSSYTQVGIVSWSKGCGDAYLPDVYTRVSSYLDFISKHVNDGKTCNRT